MADAYHHQLVVFNRKDKGIRLLTDDWKVVPSLKEIFRIIADNDLILASGHYPCKETTAVMEEAKKSGVKRMEIVHPTLIHSKHTLEEMRQMGREGVKLGLRALPRVNVRFVEGSMAVQGSQGTERVYVWSSDSGQIQNHQ
jgi:hypothetical protein